MRSNSDAIILPPFHETREFPYCVGAYSSQLSRQLGGDEAAKEFQRSVRNGDLDGKESDAIEFAFTTLDDPHDVSDEDFEHLREAYDFTDRTFVELIYIVNIVSGYNRITVTLDLEYDHDYPEEWARQAAGPMSRRATVDE